MTNDKLSKLRQVLRGIGRDAQRSEDYENGDAIGRSAVYALELLDGIELDLLPACEDIPAGVSEPLAA